MAANKGLKRKNGATSDPKAKGKAAAGSDKKPKVK